MKLWKGSQAFWRRRKTDRALNYLGLMRRAGKIELGETATGSAVHAGRARLVILASDASENARKRAEGYLYGRRTLLVPLPYTKAELSECLGKSGCSRAACTDFGLSSAFLTALSAAAPDEYGQLAEEMERRADKAARRKAAGPKRKPGREHHE